MSSHIYTFESLLTASSQEQITGFLAKQCDKMGYDSYFYSPVRGAERVFASQAGIHRPEVLGDMSIFTSYPASWVQRYQEAGHMVRDPVVKSTSSSNLPVFWERLTPRPQDDLVMDEARQHGLANGITVPVCGPNGGRALFSVATGAAPETSADDTAMFAGLVLLTAMHVHEAVLRIEAAPHPLPQLTAREKSCLQWAAHGKTSWEIGYILSISERTVIFHLANATKKLNAANRRQAVVRAISLRLISP